MLICPICKEKLELKNRTLICNNHHSFDVAKQGYVNLSRKQKKQQGDNSEMVMARTQFLENDYYDFMRQFVSRKLEELKIQTLIDMGCGQGYYTKVFSEFAKACYGFDLSKSAIRYAAGHDKKSFYGVSSIFDLPIEDRSADAITSLFVPEADDEVNRILKDSGYWIIVGPGPKHCWELKEVLYDVPYENELTKDKKDKFQLMSRDIICEKSMVDDVWSLLEMTPYRYKSPKDGLERVRNVSQLEVTFEFVVSVWRKV